MDPGVSAHMGAMEIYAESALHNTDVLPYGVDTFQIVDEAAGGVIAYCHSDSAARIVAALRAHDESVTEAINLGMLIEALTACDPDAEVLLDNGGTLAHFGKATYYRGWHNELALTPDGTQPTTVAQMLDTLRDVRVNGFTRPGGETDASDNTGVWVANYRDPSGLHVTGVRREAKRVIILTGEK